MELLLDWMRGGCECTSHFLSYLLGEESGSEL